MRNLKRALSLALASLMLVGMMVVGTSAASYPDVTSAENVEAINVLKAVGVMTGDENGKFNPAANVTRNEMAVVMCNLLDYNPDDYAGTCKFTDVPDWAKNYVAACNVNGIVSGTGDTTYNGDGNVIAVDAALMMMKALGYFQYSSDFGDDYQLAAVKQASKIDLFKGIDAGAKAVVTRNDVAQLGLNTLKATVVDAEKSGNNITIGDITISADVKYVDRVVDTDNGINAYAKAIGATPTVTAGTKYTVQLGEDLYDGDLELAAAATDEFGRVTTEWTYKDEPAASVAKSAAVTFTAKTDAADVAKALNGYYAFVDFADGSTDTWKKVNNSDKYGTGDKIEDGANDTLYLQNKRASAAQVSFLAADDSIAKAIEDLTANGKKIEIFADSNKHITSIIGTEYTVGKIDSVTTRTVSGSTYTTYVVKDSQNTTSGVVYSVASKDEKDTAVLEGEFKKGDIVTFVQPNGGKLYIYPTTSFVGAQSSNNGKVITVSGTAYKLGLGVCKQDAASGANGTVISVGNTAGEFPNSKDDANYYVDQFGFVVKGDAIAAETKYAVVNKIALIGASGTGGSKSAEAVLAFPDGTTQTVTVSKLNGKKVSEASDSSFSVITDASKNITTLTLSATVGSNTAAEGQIVTYVEKDGKYELTFVNMAASLTSAKTLATDIFTTLTGDVTSGTVTTKGVPTFTYKTSGSATKVGNSDTIYLVKTKSGDDEKFTAYTGFQNVPTVTYVSNNTIKVTLVEKDSKPAFVYINAEAGGTVGDTEAGDILYVSSKAIAEVLEGDKTIYTLTGIVNGEEDVVLKTETKSNFESINLGDFFELTVDGDGYVTDKNKLEETNYSTFIGGTEPFFKITSVTASASSGVFEGYTYTGDETVYVIDDHKLVGGDITSAAAGDTVYIKFVSRNSTADKYTIDTIYIIKAAV